MNNIKKVELFQAFHSGSNRSHKQKKIQADRDRTQPIYLQE